MPGPLRLPQIRRGRRYNLAAANQPPYPPTRSMRQFTREVERARRQLLDDIDLIRRTRTSPPTASLPYPFNPTFSFVASDSPSPTTAAVAPHDTYYDAPQTPNRNNDQVSYTPPGAPPMPPAAAELSPSATEYSPNPTPIQSLNDIAEMPTPSTRRGSSDSDLSYVSADDHMEGSTSPPAAGDAVMNDAAQTQSGLQSRVILTVNLAELQEVCALLVATVERLTDLITTFQSGELEIGIRP